MEHKEWKDMTWKDKMLGNWEMEEQIFVKPAMSQIWKVRRRLLDAVGQLGFPGKLVDLIQPGKAVHADRRVGKTKALLWAINERHYGEATLVVINGNMERIAKQLWADMFQREDVWTGHPPLPRIIMSPHSPMSIQGISDPVYCDEWFQYSPKVRELLHESGRITGAIGTSPQGGPKSFSMPLL